MAGIQQQFTTARISIGNDVSNCSITTELCADGRLLRLVVRRDGPIDPQNTLTIEIVNNSPQVANSQAWQYLAAPQRQQRTDLQCVLDAPRQFQHRMAYHPNGYQNQPPPHPALAAMNNSTKTHRRQKQKNPPDMNVGRRKGTPDQSPPYLVADPHSKVVGTRDRGNRRLTFTEEEDDLLKKTILNGEEQPFHSWSKLESLFPGRKGKQIRDRWVNYLNPNLDHSPFTRQDDLLLWKAYKEFGARWVQISQDVFQSTRPENHLKNRFVTRQFQQSVDEEFGLDAYKDACEKYGTTFTDKLITLKRKGQGKAYEKKNSISDASSHVTKDGGIKKTKRRRTKDLETHSGNDSNIHDGNTDQKRESDDCPIFALSAAAVPLSPDDNSANLHPSGTRVKQDPPDKEGWCILPMENQPRRRQVDP